MKRKKIFEIFNLFKQTETLEDSTEQVIICTRMVPVLGFTFYFNVLGDSCLQKFIWRDKSSVLWSKILFYGEVFAEL